MVSGLRHQRTGAPRIRRRRRPIRAAETSGRLELARRPEHNVVLHGGTRSHPASDPSRSLVRPATGERPWSQAEPRTFAERRTPPLAREVALDQATTDGGAGCRGLMNMSTTMWERETVARTVSGRCNPPNVSVKFRTWRGAQQPRRRAARPAPSEAGRAEPGHDHGDPGDVDGRIVVGAGGGDRVQRREAMRATLRDGRVLPRADRAGRRAPRHLATSTFLLQVLRRGRRHRSRGLRRDRRRRAVRVGVQLRPLGQPRPPAAGGHRGVRAWSGRAAGRGSRLRRRRTARRRLLERRR